MAVALLASAALTVSADEATIGRTLSSDYSAYEYTDVSGIYGLSSVAASDGTGKTGTGKEVVFGTTTTKTKVSATCYRDQDKSGTSVKQLTDGVYAGFSFTVDEGYQMALSALNVEVGVSVNMSYSVAISNGTTDLYTSASTTITNYNKSTATGKTLSESISDVTLEEGTYYVRLYYWYADGSGTKYLVPSVLTVTGDVTAASQKTATTLTLSPQEVALTSVGATADVTATVKDADNAEVSGAEVTWTSSNTEVATVDANGTITAVGEGVATITAIYAGDNTYKSATAELAVSVTDARTATTLTLDPASIEMKAGETYELSTITATVKGADDADVSGAEVTWTLATGTDYATVADGVITATAAGTATLTATYAGNDTYKGATAELTVSIASSLEDLTVIEEPMDFDFTTLDKAEYTTTTNLNDYVRVYATSSKTVKVSSSNGIALGGSGSLKDGYRVIEVKVGFPCKVTVTQNASEGRTLLVYAGDTKLGETTTTGSDVTASFLYTNGTETSIYLYSKSSGINVKQLQIEALDPVEVQITSAEWASIYYGNYALKVPDGVKAYYVSGASIEAGATTGTISLTEIANNIVPAATGVLLNGAKGTYELEVVSTTATYEANMLSGNDEAATTAGPDTEKDYYFYKLSRNAAGKNVGFYWDTANGAAFTNPAHKAYLALEQSTFSSANVFVMIINDEDYEATGISQATAEETAATGAIYDLSGRRMGTAASSLPAGIYVKDGRKVVVK